MADVSVDTLNDNLYFLAELCKEMPLTESDFKGFVNSSNVVEIGERMLNIEVLYPEDYIPLPGSDSFTKLIVTVADSAGARSLEACHYTGEGFIVSKYEESDVLGNMLKECARFNPCGAGAECRSEVNNIDLLAEGIVNEAIQIISEPATV